MSVNPGSEGAKDAREGPDEQEVRIIDAIKQNEAFQPRVWERLDRDQQLVALQETENTIAGIQGRASLPVRVWKGGEEGEYGGYNGYEILIGEYSIENDSVNEVVNTLAHEGRHAYQDYAIEHPDVHHDPDEVAAWRDNIYSAGYIDPDDDPIGYRNQPVEGDAWAYGDRIEAGIYGGEG